MLRFTFATTGSHHKSQPSRGSTRTPCYGAGAGLPPGVEVPPWKPHVPARTYASQAGQPGGPAPVLSSGVAAGQEADPDPAHVSGSGSSHAGPAGAVSEWYAPFFTQTVKQKLAKDGSIVGGYVLNTYSLLQPVPALGPALAAPVSGGGSSVSMGREAASDQEAARGLGQAGGVDGGGIPGKLSTGSNGGGGWWRPDGSPVTWRRRCWRDARAV